MSHLDALQLVVADDEGGQPGQVAEYVWWQDRDLVVAQIPENENLFVQISQNITSFAYIALSQIRPTPSRFETQLPRNQSNKCSTIVIYDSRVEFKVNS